MKTKDHFSNCLKYKFSGLLSISLRGPKAAIMKKISFPAELYLMMDFALPNLFGK